MIVKAIIIAFMLGILFSLGSGLYFLLFKEPTEQTVKALTWRIGLSMLLFILLIIGFFTGLVKPHGIIP